MMNFGANLKVRIDSNNGAELDLKLIDWTPDQNSGDVLAVVCRRDVDLYALVRLIGVNEVRPNHAAAIMQYRGPWHNRPIYPMLELRETILGESSSNG